MVMSGAIGDWTGQDTPRPRQRARSSDAPCLHSESDSTARLARRKWELLLRDSRVYHVISSSSWGAPAGVSGVRQHRVIRCRYYSLESLLPPPFLDFY